MSAVVHFGGFQIVEKEDQLGGQLFEADPGHLGGLFVGFRQCNISGVNLELEESLCYEYFYFVEPV